MVGDESGGWAVAENNVTTPIVSLRFFQCTQWCSFLRRRRLGAIFPGDYAQKSLDEIGNVSTQRTRPY